MWSEPFGLEFVASATRVFAHVFEVTPGEVRQHPAVVDVGAPADKWFFIRLLPEPGDERAQHQCLSEAHACMWRHFEGTHFQQAETAGRTVGREEFVDAELGAVRAAGGVDQQVAV